MHINYKNVLFYKYFLPNDKSHWFFKEVIDKSKSKHTSKDRMEDTLYLCFSHLSFGLCIKNVF